MTDPATMATSAAKAVSAVTRFRPWAVVTRHDGLIRDEYEDLITWARDDRDKESKELLRVRENASKQNYLYGGHYLLEISEVREEFARRWRDKKRSSQRRLRHIRENESAPVRGWRKMRRSPWPKNSDEDELNSLTVAWENEGVRRAAVQDEAETLGIG